jgi:hypothetical protein
MQIRRERDDVGSRRGHVTSGDALSWTPGSSRIGGLQREQKTPTPDSLATTLTVSSERDDRRAGLSSARQRQRWS